MILTSVQMVLEVFVVEAHRAQEGRSHRRLLQVFTTAAAPADRLPVGQYPRVCLSNRLQRVMELVVGCIAVGLAELAAGIWLSWDECAFVLHLRSYQYRAMCSSDEPQPNTNTHPPADSFISALSTTPHHQHTTPNRLPLARPRTHGNPIMYDTVDHHTPRWHRALTTTRRLRGIPRHARHPPR